MPNDWERLRDGDRIRIIRLPSEITPEWFAVHRGTLRLYRQLIAHQRVLTVWIDDFGRPWVDYGRHSLAIDDDSWQPA